MVLRSVFQEKKDARLTEPSDRMHCFESVVATEHENSRAVTFGFALTCRHIADQGSLTLIYCRENDVRFCYAFLP